MPNMGEDLLTMREKDKSFLLPMTNVTSVRLTRPQFSRLQTRAMENNTTITEVIRLLLLKGAEHYGFDLNKII